MRVIVTGGCGFIGKSFVHLLAKQGIDYRIIDKMTYAGSMKDLPKKYDLLVKDICDVTATHIVNFAAESHVDNSIIDGSPFVKTNVMGTFNLLELARKNPNFIKFIQISTDEVYGDLGNVNVSNPSRETDNLNPSSYYSSTKASADLLVQSAHRTYGLPYIITRTCNNFGERQNKEKFLPKLIHNIKNNIPVPIYGDGKQVREWVWVEDNVQCIFELLKRGITGIYNIGTGDRLANIDILHFIEQETGIKIQKQFVEDRLGHDRLYALNSFKYAFDVSKYKGDFTTKFLKDYLKEQLK